MHTLICGVTFSGKTTMAHKIAASLARKKVRLVVYDPVGTTTAAGTWPDSAEVYSDSDKFLDAINSDDVNNAVIIVDESADLFGHSNRENFWLLTRGRHFGLAVILIAQRPTMLHPSVRAQCGCLYVFRLAAADLDAVGKDFGHNLRDEVLDKGDYLYILSGTATYTRGNVFKPAPRAPQPKEQAK